MDKPRVIIAQEGNRKVVDQTFHVAALERIALLESENDFLGKASACFAKKIQRKNAFFNHDRVSQYASMTFRLVCARLGVTQS